MQRVHCPGKDEEEEKGDGMSTDLIGFGEPSRRARTTTCNAFVRMTTTPCVDGAEVVLECRGGMTFADGERSKKLVLVRGKREPRKGQRIIVRGRAVKVHDVRHGHTGRIEVLDEDTREWVILP